MRVRQRGVWVSECGHKRVKMSTQTISCLLFQDHPDRPEFLSDVLDLGGIQPRRRVWRNRSEGTFRHCLYSGE